MTITLKIDNNQVHVPDGATVLDAINASGTYISQLCKDPDMDAIGACRTCLVEIDGIRGLPASCSVPAADGMEVWTATDRGPQAGVPGSAPRRWATSSWTSTTIEAGAGSRWAIRASSWGSIETRRPCPRRGGKSSGSARNGANRPCPE